MMTVPPLPGVSSPPDPPIPADTEFDPPPAAVIVPPLITTVPQSTSPLVLSGAVHAPPIPASAGEETSSVPVLPLVMTKVASFGT